MSDYRKNPVPVVIDAGPHKNEIWTRYSYRVRRPKINPATGGRDGTVGYEYLTFYDPDSVVDRPAPAPRVPLRGACLHLWQSPDWRRELQLIKDAGANCVRLDANWKDAGGQWNQGKRVLWSDFFAALKGYGMRAIVSFLSSDPITAAEFPKFADAAAYFARNWTPDLAALEVWNEPNGEGNMTPAAYAALVKATYPAVKAAAPDVQVIVGSLARADAAAISWLNQAINAGMPRADGVAAHPYSSKWPVSTVGTALDVSGLNWLHTTLGPSVPIYVTEFGCSTVSKTVDPQYSVTEGDQARLINVAWQDVDTLPFVKCATLYNCVENGGDTIWGKWGLVRRDWTLKPAYTTFKAGITR